MENLERNNFIEKLPSSEQEIQNILRLAHQNLSDCRVSGLSADAKLKFAYDAARSFALTALRASGYRPTERGAHIATVDSFRDTVGADSKVIAQFHNLRAKRHRSAYEVADMISRAEAKEAVDFALDIGKKTLKWIRLLYPNVVTDFED